VFQWPHNSIYQQVSEATSAPVHGQCAVLLPAEWLQLEPTATHIMQQLAQLQLT